MSLTPELSPWPTAVTVNAGAAPATPTGLRETAARIMAPARMRLVRSTMTTFQGKLTFISLLSPCRPYFPTFWSFGSFFLLLASLRRDHSEEALRHAAFVTALKEASSGRDFLLLHCFTASLLAQPSRKKLKREAKCQALSDRRQASVIAVVQARPREHLFKIPEPHSTWNVVVHVAC